MIAGGTGIAPMFQVAAEILTNPLDETKIALVYACREEGDLLLRRNLEEWARKYPKRFKVHFVLSQKWPFFWFHSTGHITAKMLKEHLYAPSSDNSSTVYNLLCGPPLMLQNCCQPFLTELGHESQNIFAF